jgi:hypothetical protein
VLIVCTPFIGQQLPPSARIGEPGALAKAVKRTVVDSTYSTPDDTVAAFGTETPVNSPNRVTSPEVMDTPYASPRVNIRTPMAPVRASRPIHQLPARLRLRDRRGTDLQPLQFEDVVAHIPD